MTDAPNDAPDDSDEEYFPEFRTVRRGYDPEQVEEVLDELYTSLSDAVRDAEEQAARLQSAERAREELAAALAEAKHRITELEKRPAAGGASFESLGSRIGDMLAAAAAEAAEITRRAHEEAQALHDESEATAVTTRAFSSLSHYLRPLSSSSSLSCDSAISLYTSHVSISSSCVPLPASRPSSSTRI